MRKGIAHFDGFGKFDAWSTNFVPYILYKFEFKVGTFTYITHTIISNAKLITVIFSDKPSVTA